MRKSQISNVKCQIYKLKFKSFKILVVVLSFAICVLRLVPATYAADSTPSADIKTKLEELKREVASRAAKLKQEVTKKLNNKAYVGNLKSISSSSLTLASVEGPKLVTINQDTVYESKIKTKTTRPSSGGKTKFSQKTLSEEDYLAALGDVDETGVLTAKKIVLLTTPKEDKKTYVWGQVVSASEKLFTLKDHDEKNFAAVVPSEFKVKVSNVIIATGEVNKNDIFEAEFVYVTPH